MHPTNWWSPVLAALPLVVSKGHCKPQASAYSETLTGFNTIGDHFGYPAFADAHYDYVVVGGGTAGLAIATRLAEGGAGTVAVIEAGGFYEQDNGNLTTVPGTAAYFIGTAPNFRNPQIDWEYKAQPEAGLNGRSILYNSGKTLGGGSARNYMVYDRGSKGAYDRWASLVGDAGFKFDNILPYFKKSVAFDPPNNDARGADASVHPDPSAFSANDGSGRVHVSYSNHGNGFSSWAKKALAELGLKEFPDFVSGKLLGGYQFTAQTIDGHSQTRSSSEASYLREAISTDAPLQVYKTTLAKKILFDGSKKATGVKVNTAGVEYTLFANKEVIVSAGVHRSPQLLMVSGVGPENTLSGLGIPVVSDLAGVGQGMEDQPYFGPSFPVSIETHSAIADPNFLAKQVADYRSSRTGYLTNPGSDFLAFENLPKDLLQTLSPKTRDDLTTSFPDDWPTMQHTFADAWYGTGDDMLVGAPTDGKMYVSILPTLVATFSRGSVTINSTDTSDNPVIKSGLLSDKRDQELAVAAFKRARQIGATDALKNILTGPEAYPGAKVETDDQILSHIKRTTSPIWHASGTCRMGRSNDTNAVVDSKAQVYGVKGLRVVDASAFPLLVPCHPQATVYALAEKIAAVILGK